MDKHIQKESFLINFGKALKKARKEKNLRQHELAELANITENYYGKLERGERNISIYQFNQLACALELNLDDFFKKINHL